MVDIKFVLWNAQSFNQQKKTQVQLHSHLFDVVAITETWFRNQNEIDSITNTHQREAVVNSKKSDGYPFD